MCDQATKLISHHIARQQKIGTMIKGMDFSIDKKHIWGCK